MNYTNKILELARDKGLLRARELRDHQIPYTYLSRMVKKGLLERIGRGLYRIPDSPVTAQHSLVEACARVPHGVICLLSALSFHNMTTQVPFEVWIAIENKAWAPKAETLSLRYIRFSGKAYSEGVEERLIEGLPVKVYNPAKTVADCFKFRNKIGLDVALESLRDGLNERMFTVDQLWHYAVICRVQNVMRPYLEATV